MNNNSGLVEMGISLELWIVAHKPLEDFFHPVSGHSLRHADLLRVYLLDREAIHKSGHVQGAHCSCRLIVASAVAEKFSRAEAFRLRPSFTIGEQADRSEGNAS